MNSLQCTGMFYPNYQFKKKLPFQPKGLSSKFDSLNPKIEK